MSRGSQLAVGMTNSYSQQQPAATPTHLCLFFC
ncbi:unnamed protein product [Hymenolepis diminuta]|uniref:Alternative protein n=1 Tax=Hymenolepis diminuta TaxID=6216 RepID=A0A0R3SNQ1_HYMDI|nr:unnamed protein product [Hymenolepis diminuta]